MEAALQEQDRAAAAAATAAAAAATAAAAAAAEQARAHAARVVVLSPRRSAGVQEGAGVREEGLDSASPVYDARRASRPAPFSPGLRSPACADPAIDALLQSAVAQRTRGRTGAIGDSARRAAAAPATHDERSAVKQLAPVRRIDNACPNLMLARFHSARAGHQSPACSAVPGPA